MSNGQSLSVKMSTILLYKYRMTSLHMRSVFDINDMFLVLPGSEEGEGYVPVSAYIFKISNFNC